MDEKENVIVREGVWGVNVDSYVVVRFLSTAVTCPGSGYRKPFYRDIEHYNK